MLPLWSQQPAVAGVHAPALSKARRERTRALHMARQIAFSLVGRPISFANSVYVQDCMAGLRALRELIHAHEADRRLIACLDQVIEAPSAPGLRTLMGLIDQAHAAGWAPASWQRLPAGLLQARNYAHIVLMAGPGIGLGDETAVVPFYRRLGEYFPGASIEVYTTYPGMWRALEPQVPVQSWVNKPDRAYARIEELLEAKHSAPILGTFVNFSGLNMLQPFFGEPVDADLLEISLGGGRIWHLSPEGVMRTHCEMDRKAPNLSRALERLAEHVFPGRNAQLAPPPPATRSIQPRASPGDPFRVVINPLTSKEMPLRPEQWERLIGTIRSTVPAERPLVCSIYPGLSTECWEYVGWIMEQIRQGGQIAASDELRMLSEPSGKPLSVDRSLPVTFQAIREADLLLGMDTYTAHFAAHAHTPSLALCLDRSPLFWEQAPHTLWLDLRYGNLVMRSVLKLLIELLVIPDCSCFTGLLPAQQLGAVVALPLSQRISSALDLSTSAHGEWIATLDKAWGALPPREQSLLLRVDEEYAWPRIRPQLAADQPLPVALRAGEQLAASFFFRFLSLAAS